MDIDIRPVQSCEEAHLFKIHRAVFRSHIEQIWGWDEEWQLANFAKELESSVTDTVSVDGRIIGYLQCREDHRCIYVQNIALIAPYQGKGIGALLIKQVQGSAGAKRLPVELGVFRTNTLARKFYERLGFDKTGETVTHILMSWKAS